MLRNQGVSAVFAALLGGVLWLLGGTAHADHIFGCGTGHHHDYHVLPIPVSTGELQRAKNQDGSGEFGGGHEFGIAYQKCSGASLARSHIRVCRKTGDVPNSPIAFLTKTETEATPKFYTCELSRYGSDTLQHDHYHAGDSSSPTATLDTPRYYVPTEADKGKYIHHSLNVATVNIRVPSPATRIFHADLRVEGNSVEVDPDDFYGPDPTNNANFTKVVRSLPTAVAGGIRYDWSKCVHDGSVDSDTSTVLNFAGGCEKSEALGGTTSRNSTINLASPSTFPTGLKYGDYAQVLIRYHVRNAGNAFVSYSGYGYNSATAGAGRVRSMPIKVPPPELTISSSGLHRGGPYVAVGDTLRIPSVGQLPAGQAMTVVWQYRQGSDTRWYDYPANLASGTQYTVREPDLRPDRSREIRAAITISGGGSTSDLRLSANRFRVVAPRPVTNVRWEIDRDSDPEAAFLKWNRRSTSVDSVTHFHIYRHETSNVPTNTNPWVRPTLAQASCAGDLDCEIRLGNDHPAGTTWHYRVVSAYEESGVTARSNPSASAGGIWYKTPKLKMISNLVFNRGIDRPLGLPEVTSGSGANTGGRVYTLRLTSALPAGLEVFINPPSGKINITGTDGNKDFALTTTVSDSVIVMVGGAATAVSAPINAVFIAMDSISGRSVTSNQFTISVTEDLPGSVALSRTERVTFNQAITATLSDGNTIVASSESYQWQRCEVAWTTSDATDPGCTDIATTTGSNANGADTATYTLRIGDADDGRHIRVKIDYMDEDQAMNQAARTAYSNTVPLQLAAELSAITINKGGLQRSANYAGDILTAGEISVTDSALSAAINFGADSYAYAWQRSAAETTGFADITNATAATYAITADDVGYLRVRVTRTSTNAGPIVRTSSAILVRSTGALRLIPVPNQTYVLGQTIEVLNLGADMGGGGPAADKTYTLSESDGTLAELGLEAVAGDPLRAIDGNTSTTPIRIRSIAGETTRTGSVRLAYRVTEAVSGATPAEYSFSITVLSATVTDGELADTAVPEIMHAINATIATNIGARIRAVRNGEADKSKLQLDGANDWDSFIFQNAHAEIHGGQDWKKVFGNSRFSFAYPSENDLELPLNGYWGQGNYQTLSGEKDGIKWDGSLLGLSIGTDTVLETGNLFGVAFNRQSGSFDVTKSGRSGGYDLSLNTVSPYVSGEFMGYEYHASVHIGRGKFGQHSLKNLGASAGSSRHFRDNRFGAQHLKGDFIFSGAKVGGANVDTGRLRVLLEQHKAQTLPNGWELHLTGDIGGRLDLGAGGGLGVEAVGQARYIRGLITTYGQLRTLLFHSDDVREFGLQVRIQVAPGQDGQGLSLQLTPSYGESESGLSDLWEHGVSQAGISNSTAPNPSDYIWQMDAKLGFGLRLKDAGLLTPYASTRYGDAPRIGFGVNWKPRMRDLELDLSGEQSETQQRVLLKGTLGF